MYSPAKQSDRELLLDVIYFIKKLAHTEHQEELLNKYIAWYEDLKKDIATKDYSTEDKIIFSLEK